MPQLHQHSFNSLSLNWISNFNKLLYFAVIESVQEQWRQYFCSWGERAPPSGLIVSTIIYLTGYGDQCDVSSQNGEGRRGRSDPRDEGAGGHHWVHQAGVDSKNTSQALTFSLWPFGIPLLWHSLSATLAQTGSGISVLFWAKLELFVLFSLLSVQVLSFLLPWQAL